MRTAQHGPGTAELFEKTPIPAALAKMALPTIVSQLVVLIYNMADTWFIGQTDNPYMVAASSLVLTIFFATTALANLFGSGGGTLVTRLLGSGREDEAEKVAAFSLVMAGGVALLFSLVCLVFMNPMLRFLGASDNTIGYARQYLFFVVVIGAVPTILSSVMSTMVRNIGHAKRAGFGLSFGGILNVILDPIFMFVLLPDGYQVMGAAIATMLSNVTVFIYFIVAYRRLRGETVLKLPRRLEKIQPSSLRSLLSVGLPASLSILLFDLTNIVINRLSSAHGDIELAAVGIVLKIERFPLNVGIGICLGMAPLIAYNFAAKNFKRMQGFFSAARVAGLTVALCSVALYYIFAPQIIEVFISDPDTVMYGTQFLRARCLATPVMFLSFHVVHFTQAVNQGKFSFALAVIRQLILNIPILFLMDRLFGMMGIVHTQVIADAINAVISYIIYRYVLKRHVLPSEPPPE